MLRKQLGSCQNDVQQCLQSLMHSLATAIHFDSQLAGLHTPEFQAVNASHPSYDAALLQVRRNLSRFEQACDLLTMSLLEYVDRLDTAEALGLLQPSRDDRLSPLEHLQATLANIEQIDQTFEALQDADPDRKPAQGGQQEAPPNLLSAARSTLSSLCQI